MLTLVCDEGGGWPRGLWCGGTYFWANRRDSRSSSRRTSVQYARQSGKTRRCSWNVVSGRRCSVRNGPAYWQKCNPHHPSQCAGSAKLYFSADGEAAVRNPFTRTHPPQTKHSTGAVRRAARDKRIPACTFSRSPMCNSSNILRVWWDGRTNGAIWLSVSPRYGS